MDYLDPAKQLRHRILLMVGYVLIAVGITIGTIVLLYQAYGFGLGKNGSVIQNGLVFVSSQPHPANIYFDGKLNKSHTNARLTLPAGVYQLKLTRDGYLPWQRSVDVQGGSVRHFDYPFLIPSKLTTTDISSYTAAPSLATQSPDRRWLVVARPTDSFSFDVYDLKHPLEAPTVTTLPKNLLTKAVGTPAWQMVAWADDNNHVLLTRLNAGKTDYVLLDRSTPVESLNLTSTFGLSTTQQLQLLNKKYDQYELFDSANATLSTLTLKTTTPAIQLNGVLAYQTYGDNEILFVTADGAPSGKVLLKLVKGDQTFVLHSLPAGSNYLLDLTTYSGTLYVVAGAASENKLYIYKDPLGQLRLAPTQAVSPVQVLHVTTPTYVSFSNSAQFVMAEGGIDFGVYDIENQLGFNYMSQRPLDAPQAHASWMDGNRLTYVSNGKLVEFDYDNLNGHALVPAGADYLPAFAPDYTYVYTLAPNGSGGVSLTQTSLLTAADR
jgi:hypothetical protein